jgi:NADP-dependent 3-hydroxy acid dehydrogenase YdfG
VLVHNAGVGFPDHLVSSRIHDWRTTFDVNVIGAVALTQAMLPETVARAIADIVGTPPDGHVYSVVIRQH